jgi:hypothetical protein
MRTLILLAAALVACGKVNAPTEPARLPRTTTSIPGIVVTLTAARTLVNAGDSVAFITVVTNQTDARVQIGTECGPSTDVLVIYPNGDEHSALLDGMPPNFTCQLLDLHFVDPRSTKSFVLIWHPPGSGTYVASGGLRRGDGFGNLSAPVTVIAR